MADIDESALNEEASTLLQVWFAGSREVIASFHRIDRGLPQHASALLSGNVSEANTFWFPPARWAVPLQVESAPVDVSLPLEAPEIAGGTSLIRDQVACPFRAFARHRLNLPSLQPIVIGISASERGAFLHEALFRLWRQLESSDALASLSPSAEKNLIEEAVTAAMQQTERACESQGYSLRERVGSACWQLEQQLCVDLLAQWLGHERERSARFASWRWSKTKRCRWRACRSPCALIESTNLRMAAERSSTIKPGRPEDSLAGGASTRTATAAIQPA